MSYYGMTRRKIAITMDGELLRGLDEFVRRSDISSRSRAIEEAVREKLDRLHGVRLARECAKLDPVEEAALADSGLAEDAATWPEY